MTAASYNELMGLGSHSGNHAAQSREGYWPLLDNAASTTVVDYSGRGRNGTLIGGDNTSAKSTAGPNSWLTSCLSLNASDDAVDLGAVSAFQAGSGPLTVLARWKRKSGSTASVFPFSSRSALGNSGFELLNNPGAAANVFQGRVDPGGGHTISSNTSNTDGTWATTALRLNIGTDFRVYLNGALSTTTTFTSSPINNSQNLHIGRRGSTYFDGDVSAFAVFSRLLDLSEIAEDNDGPEPVVTSGSDTLSGTEQEGETLSVSGATWGLPSPFSGGSNGTITYTYQWTRSNDGSGSGEVDIGGATSATYTLQSADVGKYIRRRVRGTNNGGYDSGADTNSNFTGAIAAAGAAGFISPTFRRANESAFDLDRFNHVGSHGVQSL